MKLSISAAVLLLGSQIAGPALAGELATDVSTRVVRYADLDLSSPAGAAALYARIEAAARDVCPVAIDRQLASVGPARRCTEAALARAIADVNATALTNYHLARTGQNRGLATSAALRRAPEQSGGGGE